jgi:hypothetical protein
MRIKRRPYPWRAMLNRLCRFSGCNRLARFRYSEKETPEPVDWSPPFCSVVHYRRWREVQ